MPAECEINYCGVLAVGRCVECGKAMCASHRAQGEYGPIVNRCSECMRRETQKRFEIFHGLREDDNPVVQRRLHAQERIKNVARQLAVAGIAPDTPVTESGRAGRGLFGLRKEQGTGGGKLGWYVGENGWEVPETEPRSDRARSWKIAKSFVTSDGRLVMEGGYVCGEGGYYVPFKLAPYKTRADTLNLESEFWEEIASQMEGIARQRGVAIA
jgi:hypothetical protein